MFSYHLPKHISEQVDYITPGVALSAPLKKRSVPIASIGRHPSLPSHALYPPKMANESTSASNAAARKRLVHCGRNITQESTVTPECIRELYVIPSAVLSLWCLNGY